MNFCELKLQKKANRKASFNDYKNICREKGIRTLDIVTHILAFQASSFNHSDTSLFI